MLPLVEASFSVPVLPQEKSTCSSTSDDSLFVFCMLPACIIQTYVSLKRAL